MWCARHRNTVRVRCSAEIVDGPSRRNVAGNDLRNRGVNLGRRASFKVVKLGKIGYGGGLRLAAVCVNQARLNYGIAAGCWREVRSREDVRIAQDVLGAAAYNERAKRAPAARYGVAAGRRIVGVSPACPKVHRNRLSTPIGGHQRNRGRTTRGGTRL